MGTVPLTHGAGGTSLLAPAAPSTATSWPATREVVRPIASRAGGILSAVLSGAATGILLFVVGLLLTGHRETTVLTGSMSPRLPVGALVVTERVPVSEIRSGDVVVFPRPEHPGETVIHRVVSIRPTGDGAFQAHTKGDANRVEDPWILRVSAAVHADRAIAVFPGAGADIAQVRRLATVAVVLLVVIGVLWHGMRRIWSA